VSAPAQDWLLVSRGEAPLILSMPHGGTEIPEPLAAGFVSPWLARKDADWWIDRLYAMAAALDATVVRTTISRSVIDVNRDPSGASLYPGRVTTGLCPSETFDGEPLYVAGASPDVGARRNAWFDPYHDALSAEVARLRARHAHVAVYDCHSIRSVVPRLFEGQLPEMNIGTSAGASCAPALESRVAAQCAASSFSWVANARFVGGYITRHFGRPQDGVHALQMELACRSYMDEPVGAPSPTNWPTPFNERRAAAMTQTLERVLRAILSFLRTEIR
jgi:N-formylglutamate deformylase